MLKRLLALLIAIPLLAPAPSRPSNVGKAAAIAGAVALFAALASAHGPKDFRVAGQGIEVEPKFGELSSSSPGSPVFSAYKYIDIEAARLNDGTILYKTTDTKPTYCTPDRSKCWQDTNADGVIDRTLAGTGVSLRMEPENVRIAAPESGFRYELVYEGCAGGVLHLLYREFIDDLARPSFTQQLYF